MKFWKNNIWPLVFVLFVIGIFGKFIFLHKLPFPADALVGLYHPWRDAQSATYPNGLPFKNPLILDPFEQQFPYRYLAINQLKQGRLPTWNPYVFGGTPLLANIQTAVFYPLNFLYLLTDFTTAWGIQILLQPLLAGLFMYFYLQNLRLTGLASIFGSISFAFCGFMVAWLTWNTLGQTILWLPLILLAKDKLIERFSFPWVAVLIFAEISMILAGHIQTAVYAFVFSSVYLAWRIWQKSGRNWKIILKKRFVFVITGSLVLLITSIQWWPTLQFIIGSARQFDLPDWHRLDWFLPWQHLLQLVAPDFFGNPTTGNYWGVWNWGEFASYIGVIPLFFASLSILIRKDKETRFFIWTLIVCLLLALPTFIAQIPYALAIPFLSTMQPSRIIVLMSFCLAVLGAFGVDAILEHEKISPVVKRYLSYFWIIIFSAIWILVLFGKNLGVSWEMSQHLMISQRNLILPTVLVIISLGSFWWVTRQSKTKFTVRLVILLLIINSIDLGRFLLKFTPFVDEYLIYPQTKTIEFLQKNLGNQRFISTDRRLLPPNVSTFYKLATVEGYDPLYLQNYAELAAAWTRQRPDIRPASFNRIITPQITNSFITNLVGVKYILSLSEIDEPYLNLVFEEGQTRVYENTQVFPRAFFVEELQVLAGKKETMQALFANQDELKKIAFTEAQVNIEPEPLTANDQVSIREYLPNKIVIETQTSRERVLVLTDVYAPGWKVFIDDRKSLVFPLDYAFRGVIVPKGMHTVTYKY